MTDVVMPQMGESIVEGTLTKWLKKPGDTRGARRAAVRDFDRQGGHRDSLAGRRARWPRSWWRKAPRWRSTRWWRASETARRLPRRRRPWQRPKPAAAAAAAAAPPPAAAAAPRSRRAAPQPPSEVQEDASAPVCPLVRQMARENNIDLTQVKGTGAGGRITKQDVEAHLAAEAGARPPAAAPAPAPRRCRLRRPGLRLPRRQSLPLPRVEPAKTRVEPMSTMRQKIAEHMVISKRTSAHVTTVHKVDMTKVAKLRDTQQGRVPAALRLLADLPAVHHARRGGSAAAVPAAERLDRRHQHHLPQRDQYRHRGGARERADRAGDPQRRREERGRPAALDRRSGRARPLRGS